MPTVTTTEAGISRAIAQVHRAQLEDMQEETICAYLRARGWLVEWPGAVVFARVGGRDLLPPGYPPLADLDDLPFDGEDRRG